MIEGYIPPECISSFLIEYRFLLHMFFRICNSNLYWIFIVKMFWNWIYITSKTTLSLTVQIIFKTFVHRKKHTSSNVLITNAYWQNIGHYIISCNDQNLYSYKNDIYHGIVHYSFIFLFLSNCAKKQTVVNMSMAKHWGICHCFCIINCKLSLSL